MRLTTTVRPLVHGGRALAERLGRADLPQWSIAESWEVCDADGGVSYVTNGRFTGESVHDLVRRYPDAMMGKDSPHDVFPLFARFVDASGVSPVQIDDFAQVQNGDAAAVWHVVDAVPGATIRCGTQDGVTSDRLRDAITQQDFASVLRDVPVRPGNTIGIPAGTPYSFGPGMLLYSVAPRSIHPLSASRWRAEDGSLIGYDEWQHAVESVVRTCDVASQPTAHSGFPIRSDTGGNETLLHATAGIALERWQVTAGAQFERKLHTALVVTNVGAPVSLHAGTTDQRLEKARTLLLPAALGTLVVDGPADILVAYVPDLERDVQMPLAEAQSRDLLDL